MKESANIENFSQQKLLSIIANQDETNRNQANEINALRHKLQMALVRQYGRKTEKESGQKELFDEAALPEQEALPEPETTVVPEHTRAKPKRKPLPKDLPRVQHVHDLTNEEKQCACGSIKTCIGEEKSEQLEFIPAQVRVIENVRLKYACKACEYGVTTAPMPKQPIPKSMATAGLLAHVAVSKYADHLPLYRQEQILARMGIDIPRSTLCGWMMKTAELLTPLVKCLQDTVNQYDVAYADETPVQVLSHPDKPPTSKSYMWLYMGGPPDKFSIVYDYQSGRASEYPKAFLDDYKGYLHVDGYPGYESLAALVFLVGCWAHARRKFIEVTKLIKKEGLAHKAVKEIGKLYALEKQFKKAKLSPEEIYEQRQKKALPILTRLKIWLDEQSPNIPPKTPLGKAFFYARNQWPKLSRYIEDGRLEIDNNRTERSIKPFVIGRKNWLFMGSVKGAKAGATLFSLIETCKAHKIEPYAYLKYALKEIVHASTVQDIEALLPFNCDRLILADQYR